MHPYFTNKIIFQLKKQENVHHQINWHHPPHPPATHTTFVWIQVCTLYHAMHTSHLLILCQHCTCHWLASILCASAATHPLTHIHAHKPITARHRFTWRLSIHCPRGSSWCDVDEFCPCRWGIGFWLARPAFSANNPATRNQNTQRVKNKLLILTGLYTNFPCKHLFQVTGKQVTH